MLNSSAKKRITHHNSEYFQLISLAKITGFDSLSQFSILHKVLVDVLLFLSPIDPRASADTLTRPELYEGNNAV